MAEGAAGARTKRGEKTRRALLDAAASEFGDKGFQKASIAGIAARAGVAIGSFYTWFASKEAIFRALVADMSGQVAGVGGSVRGEEGSIERERAVTAAFIAFARQHKELYRIIDEAEFVDPAAWRQHYEEAARRIEARLRAGMNSGRLRDGLGEAEAWALMGMNVFLGLRYGVWGDDDAPEEVAEAVRRMLTQGLSR